MQNPLSQQTLDFVQCLPNVRGVYIADAPLAHKVWFRVGGTAQVLYKPADISDLAFFLKHKSSDVPLTVLGVGSNVLIRDQGIPGVVLRFSRNFANIAVNGTTVDVGAGFLDRSLCMTMCAEGISGFEFMAGIPGTIGGALRMNAGCYESETKDILIHALALDPKGQLHTLSKKDLGFSYRTCALPKDWIFVGARFQGYKQDPKKIAERIEMLLAEREQTQPIRERTGGSTFANPSGHSAWQLIDDAGCRGLKINGAMMSEKHCNFMINTGQSTAHDLETLGQTVHARVLQKSGIDLQWEIQRLGLAKTI